jgi:hypothetical protein
MNNEIIVVSGLPRSGTSLMMQLLDAGGIPIVTDNLRTADTDNPRGYCEFERVKTLKADASWLPEVRGKVLASQEKMLTRLGREAAPRDQIKRAFTLHLTKLWNWVAEQKHLDVLRVAYADVVAHPQEEASRVSHFLGGRLNVDAAVRAIDPSLYRNRKAEAAAS